MPTRCLLVPTGPVVLPKRRYDAALQLAGRVSAHIDVRFISPDPARYEASVPEVAIAAGVSEESVATEIAQASRTARSSLEAWCRDNQVAFSESEERLDAVYVTWRDIVGEVETEVALGGRVHDLIVVDTPDQSEPLNERVFDAAVFSTGRPTLVVPESGTSGNLLGHVAIAWNGSLEASRVIGQSINILHEADRVTLIEVATPRSAAYQSADLARYLRFHGIRAHIRRIDRRPGESVSDAILSVTRRGDVSLLMMGA